MQIKNSGKSQRIVERANQEGKWGQTQHYNLIK
jgi:hypothetical protein